MLNKTEFVTILKELVSEDERVKNLNVQGYTGNLQTGKDQSEETIMFQTSYGAVIAPLQIIYDEYKEGKLKVRDCVNMMVEVIQQTINAVQKTDDANPAPSIDIDTNGDSANDSANDSKSININGEREIPGRQKIVRGSNAQVLASHAGLNPRSKSGYEREARVIKIDEPAYPCEQPFIDERSDERDIGTNVKEESENSASSIYNTLPYEIPGFAVDKYKPSVETCSNNDYDSSSSWNAGLTKSCDEVSSSGESSMESDNDSGKTGELANTEHHGDDLNNNYDELKTLIKSIVEEVLCDIGVYPKCLKEKTSHKDPCSPLEHLHSDENESSQRLPENDTCTDSTLKQADSTEDVIKKMMNEEKLAAAEEEELDFIPRMMQPPFEFNFDNSDLNLEDDEEDDVSITESNDAETDSETNE